MKNVLEYLEHSAREFQDKVAVDDGMTAYTYSQLHELARKIGSAIAERIKPGTPVPVVMDKSAETLAIYLGIVEAGCFYVPVNPVQPDLRIGQILNTLDVQFLVTDPELMDRINAIGYEGQICYMEELREHEIEEKKLTAIREQMIDTDILYAMFTSGSTGTPKGVLVSHRAVLDFIGYFTEMFHITERDVIGNQAPFDFDVSVKDIYSTLKTGASMVIIPTAYFSTPPILLDYLCEKKVTTLIWAVSALCLVSGMKGLDYRVPEMVDKILFSGEAMPVKHLNIWRQYLPHAKFINLYGPTEITCNCTYYRIEREFSKEEKIPIGRAFPNRRIYLVNEAGENVTKPGETGEICVAGSSLAHGYYKDPEQTKKSFVRNPFQTDYTEMIYKTGDLAFYDEDENLVFCGRKDFQIKHMGHRIELGEIEGSVNCMEKIAGGCCIYDEEKKKIVLFYAGEVQPAEVLAFLKERLPRYMVPGVLRQVDRLPLTLNLSLIHI